MRKAAPRESVQIVRRARLVGLGWVARKCISILRRSWNIAVNKLSVAGGM